MTQLQAPSPAAPYARILSVGAYRPARVVTNEELCTYIDSTDEWIRTRSGISSRRFAEPDETVVTMGVAAAEKALASAGLAASSIDCVIVATFTHTHHTPGAAPEIAYELGASTAAAFDISAACAGFSHALALANDLIRAGSAHHALVIGSEKISQFLDMNDRSTAFLFGDGAGAVVVGPSDVPGISAPVWGSDGSQLDIITAPMNDLFPPRNPLEATATPLETEPKYLSMAGQTVFRWAVTQMAPVAHKALEVAGITPADLEVFIPHQANTRIIDSIVKALELPDSVAVARDLAEMGNTSAASIPIAMEAMLAGGHAQSGQLALLLGFGAGLVYAGQVVVLP